MYSLPSEHRYYKFIVCMLGDSNIQILLHVEFLAFYCSDPFPLFLGTGSLQLYVFRSDVAAIAGSCSPSHCWLPPPQIGEVTDCRC